MDRRKFLKTTLAVSTLALTSPILLGGDLTDSTPRKKKNSKNTPLRLSFQEKTAPGKTLADRFDFMEANGIVGFEPHGKNLRGQIKEYKQLLNGRNIKVNAICAGYSGCIISEKLEDRAEFDRTMKEIIVYAGELGSTGVVMVPAGRRRLSVMPHTEDTRAYFVEQLSLLGDFALKYGTTIILEPLNRKEAFYLRQVADAASICRDTKNEGVKCMGDFWHMTHDETSDYGAFYSGGQYLQHVHIASRKRRKTPGEDGIVDNYIDGFRALKEMNYPHYVSFECGSIGDRIDTVPAALKLLREQWEKA